VVVVDQPYFRYLRALVLINPSVQHKGTSWVRACQTKDDPRNSRLRGSHRAFQTAYELGKTLVSERQSQYETEPDTYGDSC